VTEANGSGGRWLDVGKLHTRGVGVGVDEDGSNPPYYSGATRGTAGFTTAAATPASTRGGGFRRHGAVGGGGGDLMEVSTGRSCVVGIDEDRAIPLHHSGVTGGAAGFTTAAATQLSARSGGFGCHGAVGGGGGDFVEVLTRRSVAVGIDEDGAASLHHLG